ncbi:Uncharacterised protein [Shigella flexneri]|nr:Uncharacterised protein [Shigella flexneri]
MKPVWASFYCLANWESYASAISALPSISRSPRYPAIWHCCVKAGYCWTASKVSGFITAYRRIFQHGRRKLLMKPGDVNRKRFRQLSATWPDKTVPETVRTFAVKNLAKHIWICTCVLSGRHYVTGRRYLCPDHRIGYLAAERFRHRLECNARRGTGVGYGRGSSG